MRPFLSTRTGQSTSDDMESNNTSLTTAGADIIPTVNTKKGLMAVREAWPEFRNCNGAERSNRLYLEIQYAAMMDGQDIPKESLVIMAREVGVAMMDGPASGLTYPEIRTAIRRGAAGEYGDWYRLNVRTVMAWLNSFIEDNKATYREIQRMRDRERVASMGEWYLEKVRAHAEEMLRRRGDKSDNV